jgi:3-isopropylmalate/(R)-2-methylmalate dehydratase large subunit
MATLFEKIWAAHVVMPIDAATDLVAIDRVFLHERTGAAALNALRDAGRGIADSGRVFATMDHIVSTQPGRGDATEMPGGSAFITQTRAAAIAAGITLFDVTSADQGIVHVISPELGIVLPGLTLVCPDSHTCTQGALGALAWGIGSTEAEHALATGTLRVTRPRTMRITVAGALADGVTAKDLALHVIARLGAAGGVGYAVEYAGSAVRALPMEARLTLCNMATEFGAFTALIAADEVTLAYLRGRRYAPDDGVILDGVMADGVMADGVMAPSARFASRSPCFAGGDQEQGSQDLPLRSEASGSAQPADGAGTVSPWQTATAHWRTLASDAGACFDAEHHFTAADVAPMIGWGTSPQQSIAIDGCVPATADGAAARGYMGLQPGQPLLGLPIDAAFIGSCTNSRLSDLHRAAAIVRGRQVAAGVRAIVVPGSQAVKRAAEAAGLHRVFGDAGFEWRESGCSMCFYAGGESFGPHQRVISSTNRNFESRQGPGTRTHIASPETVAASAIAGAIADPRTAHRHG